MLSVTKKPFGCVWLAFVLIATTAAQDRITAEQILTKLDRIRQPARSFAVSAAVTEFREGKKDREATFRMFARKMGSGFDSLTVCLSPAADLNKLLLARGNKLWFYDPKSARPVPVSPYQFRNHSFVFDAVNNNLEAAYVAQIEGEQAVSDLGRTQRKARLIKLIPRDHKSGLITRYWLDNETSSPIKSEILTGDGKVLRTVYYSELKNVLGETRPTKIVVVNPVERSVAEVKFSAFSYFDAPDSVFEEDLMPKALGLLPRS
jgi:outer membrane lipoprotein-sorting protein